MNSSIQEKIETSGVIAVARCKYSAVVKLSVFQELIDRASVAPLLKQPIGDGVARYETGRKGCILISFVSSIT
jgi:hypothetical protein